MHSKNCAFGCVFTYTSCVKILTHRPIWLCFLQKAVLLKNFLTQFLSFLSAAVITVFTSLKGGLYTLNTGPITKTKFNINFYYFC